MDQQLKTPSRKRFLLWGTVLLSSLAALKFMPGSEKKKKETVKMLAQDGTLVEVNVASLPPKKKRITNKELQNWITKK